MYIYACMYVYIHTLLTYLDSVNTTHSVTEIAKSKIKIDRAYIVSCTNSSVRMYVCMYICMFIHMYICIHVCMYIRCCLTLTL